MATERTFDYEYLKRLIRDNPTATLRELAGQVTMHERAVRKDPGYGPIMPHAIGAAKSRYRDAWETEGVYIPESQRSPRARTQPFANLPKEHWQSTLVQYLRTLTRMAKGEVGLDPVKVRGAVNFAAKLEEHHQVVDLTGAGRPYVRDARPDELDGEGSIIYYSARFPGLTERQWRQLGTPMRRADASLRFLEPGYDHPEKISIAPEPDVSVNASTI